MGSRAVWEDGDPSRTEILSKRNVLDWQTCLSASTEPKGTFGALANQEGVRPLGSRSPEMVAQCVRGVFVVEVHHAASAYGKGDPVSQNFERKSAYKSRQNSSDFQAPTDLLTKWKLLQAIVADPLVDACGKLVAARLLDHCNTKTGRYDPSYQTVADAIGYSRRHVMRAVRGLVAAGWISIKCKRPVGRLALTNSGSHEKEWGVP
jgi:hypothetical protein